MSAKTAVAMSEQAALNGDREQEGRRAHWQLYCTQTDNDPSFPRITPDLIL
jgi:hypothetical protein